MKNNVLHVLVVDDEAMIHVVTEMALRSFEHCGYTLQLHNVYTGAAAIEFLNSCSDDCPVAIVLLDIVMETLTAGIDTIPAIRASVSGRDARILIRSGQAGRIAHHDMIRNHNIHGYYDKISLDGDELVNAIILALRNYLDIQKAHKHGKTMSTL